MQDMIEVEKDKCWRGRMQDIIEVGKDKCWRGRMQDMIEAGKDKCWRGRMQDRTDAEQNRCRKGRMQDMTDAGKDKCWRGKIHSFVGSTVQLYMAVGMGINKEAELMTASNRLHVNTLRMYSTQPGGRGAGVWWGAGKGG